MSSLTHGSDLLQVAQQFCFWFVVVGLAVSAHTAQSEEVSFAIDKNNSTIKLVSSDTYWKSPYQVNPNITPNPSRDSLPSLTNASNSFKLLRYADTKKEEEWSLNIQMQGPADGNCSPSTSLACLDSKDERPDIKPQHESYWLVLRKAFHF
jgi:hypothetical protein